MATPDIVKRTPLDSWIGAKIGAETGPLQYSDLQTYQLEQLHRTIRLGREKSPFYSKHFLDAPPDLSSLEDLARFPFTTPDDIRREGQRFLCVSQGDIQRVVTLDTSGTMGEPKRVYFTRADQELTIDFFQHGMSTFTKSGDRVMILLPYERPGRVGDLLATALGRLNAVPVRYGPVHNPQDAIAVMDSEHCNVLVGAPTNVLTLARFWEDDKQIHLSKPEQVLLSTDHVPQAIVAALEKIWGCTVYNHYGMTEMGLGGGVECPAREGYHVREADLYFEIIDPLTGQPLPEGEMGEVVFTTLTRQGMPLIRYRTGDLSRFIPGQCPCGTVLLRMEKITRRLDSVVRIHDPQDSLTSEQESNHVLSMADLDEALFSLIGLVNFSARITGQVRKERLEIKLTVIPNTNPNIIKQALLALESIPAIQVARQAKILDVDIHLQDFDATRAGNLAKRILLDQRGEHYA